MIAVDDGGPDPVSCLAQGGIRQTDEEQGHQPVFDVGFDLHDVALDSGQRDRIGAGERHLRHPANMLDAELVRSCSQDADDIDPDLIED